MNKENCILYFTLTPDLEAGKKQLSCSRRANFKLIQKMYAHTKHILSKSNVDIIEVNEDRQVGDAFGVRISHAIEQVFSQGYQNVIVVGNDCVDLNTEDLLKANSQLEMGALTIGETKEGGVYLFTLTRSCFDFHSFSNLSWCQHTLAEELYQWLSNTATVHCLSVKSDINTGGNLLTWITSVKHDLAHAFKSLISLVRPQLDFNLSSNLSYYSRLLPLRAPPLI